MVTGVETAGLVLGTIPLILKSLEFYMQGITITRRCFRYREDFRRLIHELSTENTFYINTMNLLLIGTVKPKDMAEFLSNPLGIRWKEEKFDRKLKQRLGTSYEPYMNTMNDLIETVEMFKRRLKLDPASKVSFRWLFLRHGIANYAAAIHRRKHIQEILQGIGIQLTKNRL
jgi:hypothetical protein